MFEDVCVICKLSVQEDGVRPTEQQQEAIKELMIKIGLRQNAVASLCGVNSGVLSDALNPLGKRPVSAATWDKISEGLREAVAAKQSTLEAKGQLPACRSLLALLFDDPEPAHKPPHLPGAPLPLLAPNYIERPCDRQMKEVVTGSDLLATVQGPMQSGRSSLLIRAEAWAKDAHQEVTRIDFGLMRGELEAVGNNVLTLVGQVLGLAVDQDVSGAEFHAALATWLSGVPKKQVLLLDNMDALLLIGEETVMPVLMALTRAISDAARPNSVFLNLATICVFGGELWSALQGSSFLSLSTQIFTPKFSQEQVGKLAEAVLGSHLGELERTALFALFAGHPYLTHLYLEDRRQGLSPAEARLAAEQLGGAYRIHCDRMHKRLLSVVRDTGKLNLLMVELSRHTPREPGRVTFANDNALHYFGVLEQDGALCHLYAAMAQRVVSGNKQGGDQ